uniref:Uncharacterized protein n=1 Tax=Tetranychus urticae TaxID=32264 RepID=T1JU58_TETUR
MFYRHYQSVLAYFLICVVIGSNSFSENELLLKKLKNRLVAVTSLKPSSESVKFQQSVIMQDEQKQSMSEAPDTSDGPSSYQNPVDAIRETIINTIIREVSSNLPEVLRQTTEFFSQMRAAIVKAFTEYAEQNPNYLNESSTNRTLGGEFIKIVDSIVTNNGRVNSSRVL